MQTISFYRIFLGLNLSLLASFPVAAQVRSNLPPSAQNLLDEAQNRNLPAKLVPFSNFPYFNDFVTENQDTRFVNPANRNPVSSPKKNQPQSQPLLTSSVPIGLQLDSNCPGEIEARGFNDNATAPTVNAPDCK